MGSCEPYLCGSWDGGSSMGLRNGAYVYGKYRCWSMVNVKGCIVSLGDSED
jgi:hypothetical protein